MEHPDEAKSSDDSESSATHKDGGISMMKAMSAESERQDLLASLEHCIVVGNAVRHQMWRIEQWERQDNKQRKDLIQGRLLLKNPPSTVQAHQEEGGEEETSDDQLGQKIDSESEASEDDDSEAKGQDEDVDVDAAGKHDMFVDPNWERIVRDVHPHDIRLYGMKGNPPPPWPNHHFPINVRQQGDSIVADETTWEREQGDAVNPVVFSATRLAQSLPTDPAVRKRLASQENTDNGLERSQETPRAFLLHCWDRAMHAASACSQVEVSSCTVDDVGKKEDDRRGTYSDLASNTADRTLSHQQRFIREHTEARSKSLHLQLEIETRMCPCCKATFSTSSTLADHYYGTSKVRGCSWHRIDEKERGLIAGVLHNHAQAQVTEAVRFFMNQSVEAARKLVQSGVEKQTLNWRYVLGLFESKFERPRKKFRVDPGVQSTAEPLYESMAISPEGVPVLCNPQLLTAVRRRLAERYTKVPR